MRTRNGLLNFITGYTFYFILAILGIVKVKIFISSLGQELYALNQLYINLFAYLSLAEAGIGVAFTFRLYKLLAEKKYNGINSIFSGTKVIFKRIGILVLLLGFLFSFIVPIFIKGSTLSNPYILLTFYLFIIKNSIDYFMFVPRLIIQADQKMYKITVGIYGFRVVEVIVEIVLLLLGFNYLIILIPGIFIRIVQNLFINKKVYNFYPWLKVTKNKDFTNAKDIKNVIVHRMVGLVTNNTDIVVISTFIGSNAVAIYASYNYLIKFAMDTTNHIINSLKDGLGNVMQLENKEKANSIINELISLFLFFASLLVVVFFFILDDFIIVWLGKEYLLKQSSLILLLIILYFNVVTRSMTIIQTAMGLFKETKVIVSIEAFIKLLLSLLLVTYMGLNGILFSTIFSIIVSVFWYYPFLIYKKLQLKNTFKYLIKVLISIMINLLLILLLKPIYSFLDFSYVKISIINWFITSSIFGIIVLILLLAIYLLVFKEFKYIIIRMIKLTKNKN